jgi:hypothetical protein
VPCDLTGFTEVRLLFWRGIESDHMRPLHGLSLLQRGVFEHFPIGVQAVQSSRENGHDGYQVPN